MSIQAVRNRKSPMHYGSANGYNWVHDPFSNPLEKKKKLRDWKSENERRIQLRGKKKRLR
jgi:hypothetical protein